MSGKSQAEECVREDGDFCRVGLSAHFKIIFNMVGATKFTGIFDSADNAIEALKAQHEGEIK